MYECGANVSLVDTLLQIAKESLGVTSEDEIANLRSHLENNVGARDVMKEIQTERKRYNISGVPYFIIGAKKENDGEKYVGRPYGFSGAQEGSTFVDMFEELAGNL